MVTLSTGLFTNAEGIQRTPAAILSGLGRTLEYYGAKGDVVRLSDGGAVSAASTAYSNSGASFAADDVGKDILIRGAGASGADHITTIATYVSATAVTLTDAAETTVTDAATDYATNDSEAFQAAFDAGIGTVRGEPGKTYNVGTVVYMQSNCYIREATITTLTPFASGMFRVTVGSAAPDPRDLENYGFSGCKFFYAGDTWVPFFAWITTNNTGFTSSNFVFDENIIDHGPTKPGGGDDNWCIILRGVNGASVCRNRINGEMQLIAGGSNTNIENAKAHGNILIGTNSNAIAFTAGYTGPTAPAPVRRNISVNDNIIIDPDGDKTSIGIFIGLDGEGGKGGPARAVILDNVSVSGNIIVLPLNNSTGVLVSTGVDQFDGETPATETLTNGILISQNYLNCTDSVLIRIDGDNARIATDCVVRGNTGKRFTFDHGGWFMEGNDAERARVREFGGRLEVKGGRLSSFSCLDTPGDVVFDGVCFKTTGTYAISLQADTAGVAINALVSGCIFEGADSNTPEAMIRSYGTGGDVTATVVRPTERVAWGTSRFVVEDGQTSADLVVEGVKAAFVADATTGSAAEINALRDALIAAGQMASS